MSQTTENAGVVRLIRTLSAPAADVYKAFVDPDQVARWYGPAECSISNVRVDAREGGAFRAQMVADDGTNGHFVGEFHELVPGERIVMDWSWEDSEGVNDNTSTLTIELREQGPDSTELTLIHELGERTPGGFAGVTEGWTGALDKLVALFASDKS